MRQLRSLGVVQVLIVALTACLAVTEVRRCENELLPVDESFDVPEISAQEELAEDLKWTWHQIDFGVCAFLRASLLGVGLAIWTRPSLLRDRRGPGPGVTAMALCPVLPLASVADVCLRSGLAWAELFSFDTWHRLLSYTEQDVPWAISAVWGLLLLGKRWRPQRTLLDRLGRFLAWLDLAWTVMMNWLPVNLAIDLFLREP